MKTFKSALINRFKTRIVFLFIPFGIIFFAQCGVRQHRGSATGWDYNTPNANYTCHENGNLSVKERLRKYPFNEAVEVKIISFERNQNPLKGDSLNPDFISESVTLKADQINELTNILYNFNFSDINRTQSDLIHECYIPRHAVLFYNSNGEMYTYMEYCFECHGNKAGNSKTEMGVFCMGKYDLLKSFFAKNGITRFGLVEEEKTILR